MPIRTENKNLYPDNWGEISAAIRKRAGNQCEWCGVKNYSIGHRDKGGVFVEGDASNFYQAFCDDWGFKRIKIILTVAHLDHNPANCDPKNLLALCQKCHNGYDAQHRADGIKRRRLEAAGQTELGLK